LNIGNFSFFMMIKRKILLILISILIIGGTFTARAATYKPLEVSVLAHRYERYLKYEKYQLYKEYKEVKKYKNYKKYSDLYRLYKKSPKKYASYAKYKSYYDNYQKYQKKKKYASYGKYAFFNNEKNKKYSTTMYKAAYDQLKSVSEIAVPDQNQNQIQPVLSTNYSGSPKIKVGLDSYKKSDLDDKAITIKVNSSSRVQEEGGAELAKIPDNTEIRIFFDFSERVYRAVSINLDKSSSKAIVIIPDNKDQGVCDVSGVGSYRDSIEVRFSSFTKRLWVINELPIEYYVWGMGEASNSSPVEYLRALNIAYRTYGYWKVKNGTSYEKEGFHVTDTGSSQVYGGFNRENNQPNIVSAAKATSGLIVKYGDRIAITPYCSGTDGNTRSWENVWGSNNYPWCQSVSDPLGIKSNATTLSGNHMVGMSATGAYNYAKQQGWGYEQIIKYYYQGVSLAREW